MVKRRDMKKQRGETLVESLISLFFIAVVIVPVSNIFLRTYRTNVKIDRKNYINAENENMMELLKTKKYEEISAYIGKHQVSDIEDFYRIFSIEGKYRVLKKSDSSRREIEIARTESFYGDESGNRKYILEISVDGKREYYFPF